MESYGVLSIIPPLTVILLALWTKKTLFSLIVGTYIGSLILVTVAGGFVYLIKTSGMSRALGEFAGRHLKTGNRLRSLRAWPDLL